MKIRSDDTNLPYKTTKISPLDSKRDIDGILARWGIKKVAWIWDMEGGHVSVSFELNENFRGLEVNTVVRLEPPVIWKKKKRRKPEEIDWKMSMRLLHWWIKNQLAMIHAMQGEKILAFLPHIAVTEETTLGEHIIPHLQKIRQFKALPGEAPTGKVIEAEAEEIR